MKKIYFLATAAIVAMTGCTRSESLDGLNDLEISFDAFSGNTTTKVGFGNGKITDPNFQFASVAYYTEDAEAWTKENAEDDAWANADFLGTQWLKFTDIKAVTEGKKIVSFKSETKAYWPKQGYLNFFSWYPSMIETQMSKGALKIAEYEIKATADEDLMVADPALNLLRTDDDAKYTPTDANYTGVKTLFRHKLTKIGVQAKVKNLGESNLESFTVTVKSVKIVGVSNKGALQANLDYTKDAWKVDTTTNASYQFPMPETDKLVKVQYPYLNGDDTYKSVVKDKIMLLPQTRLEMGNDAKLELTCDLTYKINGQNDPIVEKNLVYSTTISDLKWDDTNDKWVENPDKKGGPKYIGWGINKYVIYRLVLGLDEIEWAPEVADWDATQYVQPIDVE